MSMMFSRTAPSLAKLKGLLTGEGRQAKTEERRTAPAVRVLDTKPRAARVEVIRDVKEVPQGRYLQFSSVNIPFGFNEGFALLGVGDKSALLLVADDAVDSHLQFDLLRRVNEAGFKSVDRRAASREVIKSIHESHQKAETGEQTDVEVAAWEIVEAAVDAKASDIHIETRESFAQVFYRINGRRVEQPSIAMTTATDICNVLYSVHADGDNKGVAWDEKTVKNTVIEHETDAGTKVQLRFSSAPIHPTGNFHAVIRLLVMDGRAVREIEDFGYTDVQTAYMDEMLIGSQGLVVLTGPTNSGKSTTMQALIARIYEMRGPSIKVLTIEDPVEYIMPRACQSGIPHGRKGLEDEGSGSIFNTFLKASLRQDPDVQMIGEIRDNESADSVKNLALTGRKVLSTLHVNKADMVFSRLREIGVPDSVLFMDGFINGVICQRLVPVLCPDCSIPIAEAHALGRVREKTYQRVLRVADLEVDNVRSCGDGCEHCEGTGIIDRTLCAEVLVPDETYLAYMAEGDLRGARQHWLSIAGDLDIEGYGVSMVAHAIQKMKDGLLDPMHVEMNVGKLTVAGSGANSYAAPAPMSDLPPSLKYRGAHETVTDTAPRHYGDCSSRLVFGTCQSGGGWPSNFRRLGKNVEDFR